MKQHRQVIIVTHNANLVVNCDVLDMVIIATNNDEVISYRSGALEYGGS